MNQMAKRRWSGRGQLTSRRLSGTPDPKFKPLCGNLNKKPWPYNPNIAGFILSTLIIKAPGFLIRYRY